jgi:hypothetical protein
MSTPADDRRAGVGGGKVVETYALTRLYGTPAGL